MRTVIFLFVVLLPCSAFADMQTYTLPLKYSTPDSVLPSLEPLVPFEGYITSHNNTIVVHTTEENLATLESVLSKMDVPETAIMISVRRGSQEGSVNTQININGQIQTNQGGISTSRNSPSGNYTKTTTRHTRGALGNNSTFSVRGLSGRPSYIQTGSEHLINRNSRYDSNKQQFKPVVQGFYATPYIYNNTVTIEISTQHDSHNRAHSDTINAESVNTTVNGQVGKWIPIAGIHQGNNSNTNGITNYRSHSGSTNQTVYLKVDVLR